MAAAIVIGVAVGAAVAALGTLLVAYMIGKGRIAVSSLGVWAMVIQALSAAAGAWTASSIYKQKRLLICAINALGIFLLLLAMTALFFGGQYEGLLGGLAMNLLGSGSAVLPVFAGKGKKSKVKIPAYR